MMSISRPSAANQARMLLQNCRDPVTRAGGFWHCQHVLPGGMVGTSVLMSPRWFHEERAKASLLEKTRYAASDRARRNWAIGYSACSS